jgi:hypothetical protein
MTDLDWEIILEGRGGLETVIRLMGEAEARQDEWIAIIYSDV